VKEKLRVFLSNFFRPETTVRALKVAIIVAPILIIINHHDSILAHKFTRLLFLKTLLTFLVPYSVSAYSSARAYSEKARCNNESM
jgi:hypothetical protein